MEAKAIWFKFNDQNKLFVRKDLIEAFFERDAVDRMEIILYVPGNQIQLLYTDKELYNADLKLLKGVL